jgi:hypothetical protein
MSGSGHQWDFPALTVDCRCTCDKSTRRAKFRFSRRANHSYESRHPVPKEGALAIVTERWDGMWWTLRHRARDGIAGRDQLRERSLGVLTSGVEAYGKDVWTRRLGGWRQVLRRRKGSTGPACQIPRGDGGEKSPILRGERVISRKAIAQGMSDVLR